MTAETADDASFDQRGQFSLQYVKTADTDRLESLIAHDLLNFIHDGGARA